MNMLTGLLAQLEIRAGTRWPVIQLDGIVAIAGLRQDFPAISLFVDVPTLGEL